jgi:hypothetical protein
MEMLRNLSQLTVKGADFSFASRSASASGELRQPDTGLMSRPSGHAVTARAAFHGLPELVLRDLPCTIGAIGWGG